MANNDRTSLAVDGRITKGLLLAYAATTTPVKISTAGNSDGTLIKGLQQIPDVGGNAETIEVTTFNDHAHTFINGLLTYGDSIEFTCLHDKNQFATLAAITTPLQFAIGLPDADTITSTSDFDEIGTVAQLEGELSVKINGVGTNEALTDTIAITPKSTIQFTAATTTI